MKLKRRLSRQLILETALDVVDRNGLESLTMRSLGRVLGVTAMSLYRYVPSKAYLHDGLQEILIGAIALPSFEGPWPEAIRDLATAFRTMLAAHPHAVVLFARPAASQTANGIVDQVLRLLESQGVSTQHAFYVFQSVLAFVVGHCMWQFGPGRPLDVEDEFTFGLDALIQGLQAKTALGS